MPFRNNISKLLGERRENISDLSKGAKISYPACIDLYHDRTKQISFETLDKLVQYFGVSLEKIFEYVPPEERGILQ
jgi:DNA-binding Xre family transcriptional regulator